MRNGWMTSISLLVAIWLLAAACTTPAATPAPTVTPTTAPIAIPTKAPAAEGVGKRLFIEQGCIGCHKVNGEGGEVGPSLVGIWGQTVELVTGEKVVRDHEYFEESIENPDAKVVKGYQPGIMPKFSLTHEQIHELEEFIKSLK